MSVGSAEASFLLLFVLIALVGLTILALSIVVTVQAYQAGRKGWWVYLICIFINPLNLVAIIAWFAYLKKNPIMSNGEPFL